VIRVRQITRLYLIHPGWRDIERPKRASNMRHRAGGRGQATVASSAVVGSAIIEAPQVAMIPTPIPLPQHTDWAAFRG